MSIKIKITGVYSDEKNFIEFENPLEVLGYADQLRDKQTGLTLAVKRGGHWFSADGARVVISEEGEEKACQ
jgi:hypothetical protein